MDIQIELSKILPLNRLKTRYIDLVSFAADAGFYYLVPRAVVQPVNETEIIALFSFSTTNKIPLVFRTGGTSLSGQSITDGILVDLSQHWNKITVETDGALVRVQPGITGAMVNAYLRPYKSKIGPDPASISAAMMGGILSNNSSGMCCGVKLNSYHTTKYIRFILPDGKLFNTEEQADYLRFKQECSELFTTIAQLKTRVLSNDVLYQKIRRKYQTKNTVGYSLNAFIDYDHPLDILAHLLIGAEGTLAFIAEAVLETVPDFAYKSTALLYFADIFTACQAIVPLKESGAMMVELIDRASLRAVENLAGMPQIVKELPDGAAALLVEFQDSSYDDLAVKVNSFLEKSETLSFYTTPVFSSDPKEQDFLWKVRKGLFPAVGAVRASGTTVVLEDVAFPVERLGDAILDLQQLFVKYNYTNAIIFGHAKDGNIHFVITQSFNTEPEIKRYALFMQEIIALVIEKYDGTLKAEHGTGRNMAPFVETEWSGDAYEIMKLIKIAVDPHSLLNPGVIINDDSNAHLKNLKELPSVEEEVDRCIECGYCEHKCPSRNITTTPRRRIVIRRVLKRLKDAEDLKNHDLLLKQYQYDGLDTCAVDGLCATACPVDINTGDLVKRLRRENHSSFQNSLALFIAKHFELTQWLVRAGLKIGFGINDVMGKKAMFNLTGLIKKLFHAFPLWPEELSKPPHLSTVKMLTNNTSVAQNTVVYFPACISRVLGSYPGKEKNLMETFMSICNKSSVTVLIPENINSTCCSQIFSSKGFKDAYAFTANEIVNKLWIASKNGSFPVIIDVSSCAYTLHQIRPVLTEGNQAKFDLLKIFDAVDFVHDFILPRAVVKTKKTNIVLHPVCSLEKMKTTDKFAAIARHLSEQVTIPKNAGCCGMAGDRGFLFPEMTHSATLAESLEVKTHAYDGYYSSTKTCEMAMSKAVSKNYESILFLADECL